MTSAGEPRPPRTSALGALVEDLRNAVKTLRARPGFTWLAILSLACSVGANLVVFTVVNALWLKPRAIVDPGRVVMVTGMNDVSGTSEGFYFAEYGLEHDVRSQPVFEAAAGQVATSGENSVYQPHVAIARLEHEVETLAVTSDYFRVMGVRITGRDFTKDDDRRGAPLTAIISDRLWRTAFNAAPYVIGEELPASPMPVRIIGVAPPGFRGARLGETADLWIPRYLVPQVAQVSQLHAAEGEPPLLAWARLTPGIPVGEAMRRMATSADPARPSFASAASVVPVSRVFGSPVNRTIVVESRSVFWIASVTAALVLLAGCTTLLALLLAHYERRRQELAIRVALGCSRTRLFRVLFLELGGLIAGGATLALIVAAAGLRALPAVSLPGGLDLARVDLSFDGRVLLVAALAALVTVALAAQAPLRRSTRFTITNELVSTSAKSAVSSLKLRRDVMAVHAAATVVVLVGATLFVRTVAHAYSAGTGFAVAETLFVDASLGTVENDDEQTHRRVERIGALAGLVADLGALPGVTAVSLGGSPLGLDQTASASHPWPFQTEGRVRLLPTWSFTNVGPAYFDVLNVRLLAGRGLTVADAITTTEDKPVIVTHALADLLWPGESPLERVFGPAGTTRLYRVVGVVDDVTCGSLHLDQRIAIFGAVDPGGVVDRRRITLALRAHEPERLVRAVRHAVLAALPDALNVDVATGTETITRDLGRERLGAWFFSGFGAIALVLGVGGVFGLVAYLAESRRREMGIRLALGAVPRHVVRLIFTAGLWPVLAGTGAGLAVSLVLGRIASSMLLGVRGTDPAPFAIVCGLVLAATAAAGLKAAWRVRRLSPTDILRAE